MSQRALNFGPGPGAIPLPVLEQVQAELLNFAGTGMSVLEVSHRGKEYEAVHNEAQVLLKELLGLGDDYQVLFFGGGASTQFSLVPMNLLTAGKSADYVLTGTWAQKAYKESCRVGTTKIAGNTEVNEAFTRIPKASECTFDDNAAYAHITSNNTIFGTQWHSFPKTKAPLIVDMSSDILSRRIDATQFGLIYAGAQKNLGPAGVTIGVIRKDLLATANEKLAPLFSYKAMAKENSLVNTPPCFAIYMVGKTLQWIKSIGGLAAIEKENNAKTKLLYDTIDAHPDFYRAPVEKDSRSHMNVVFRLPDEDHEKRFLKAAEAKNMIGLKGHRSVGGIRVSMYNAVSLAWIEQLTDFMKSFAR